MYVYMYPATYITLKHTRPTLLTETQWPQWGTRSGVAVHRTHMHVLSYHATRDEYNTSYEHQVGNLGSMRAGDRQLAGMELGN